MSDGSLKIGDPLPSERELCAQFGVSSITVRHALKELVNEGRIVRQVGVGSFFSSARKRPRLGLVVVGFEDDDWRRNRDIFGDLIGGLALAAWEQEAVFSLVRIPSNATIDRALKSLVAEQQYDGVILRTSTDFSPADLAPLFRGDYHLSS